jgi:hypothetical protein
MNKFSIFPFGQIINKIQSIIFEVLYNVQMKYGFNRIKIRLLTQQVG